MIMINAEPAKYGTISITAAGCTIPKWSDDNSKNHQKCNVWIPVFLKNAFLIRLK